MMKNAFSTTLLAGGFLAASTLSAFAGGCNWGHAKNVTASAETQAIPEQVATILDENQVLDTGHISVAQVDCAATPDAAECIGQTSTASN